MTMWELLVHGQPRYIADERHDCRSKLLASYSFASADQLALHAIASHRQCTISTAQQTQGLDLLVAMHLVTTSLSQQLWPQLSKPSLINFHISLSGVLLKKSDCTIIFYG